MLCQFQFQLLDRHHSICYNSWHFDQLTRSIWKGLCHGQLTIGMNRLVFALLELQRFDKPPFDVDAADCSSSQVCQLPTDFCGTFVSSSIEAFPVDAFFTFGFENVQKFSKVDFGCEFSIDAVESAVADSGLGEEEGSEVDAHVSSFESLASNPTLMSLSRYIFFVVHDCVKFKCSMKLSKPFSIFLFISLSMIVLLCPWLHALDRGGMLLKLVVRRLLPGNPSKFLQNFGRRAIGSWLMI